MNVFWQELKLSRKSALLWTSVMLLVSLMYQSIYPSFAKDAEALKETFAHMPKAAASALNVDVSSFLTFLGFYVVTLTLISLIAACFGMSLGLNIFAREEQVKTTDFLLTKPIERSRIFFAKFFAGLLVLFASMFIYTVATLIMAHLFGASGIKLDGYLVINLVLFGIIAWFYLLAIFVTQIRRIKSVIGVTLAAVFSFFAVSIVGSLIGDAKFRYFSPFKAIDFMQIVSSKHLTLHYALPLIIAIVLGLSFAYIRYNKKDVRGEA